MTYTAQSNRFLRSVTTVAALAGVLVLGGCKNLEVENLNGVSSEDLLNAPTRDAVITATQALLSTWRGTQASFPGTLSRYGYELWQARASEPRTVTNAHRDPLTGGFWSFGGLKNGLLVLDAVDKVSTFTTAEKEGIKGFAKTVMAMEHFSNLAVRETYGTVLDLPADPLTDIPPIANAAAAWTRIFQLLDQADTHLGAAGASFPFTLNAGFAGFNTPTTFRRVNRALRAKFMVLSTPTIGSAGYSAAAWAPVITLLTGTSTFINTTASGLTFAGLHAGPFFNYGSPDGTNGLAAADRYVNNRLRTEAQCKTACTAPGDPNGDNRAFGATAKARTVAAFSLLGVSSSLKQTDILNPIQTASIATTSSLPIIRNEELILLLAEAYLNAGDNANAVATLNLTRVNRGGLPPISNPYVPDATLRQPADLIDVLLYEKRYSLWGEQGTAWLDGRRYPPGPSTVVPAGATASRIWDITVPTPLDFPFRIYDRLPLPISPECEVRTNLWSTAVNGCFQGGYAGFAGTKTG